jgi:hypothetical protein
MCLFFPPHYTPSRPQGYKRILHQSNGEILSIEVELSASITAPPRRDNNRGKRLAGGMVNVTADTPFPGIFLDTHVPQYKECAER